jgi:hypothetical protein
MIKHLLVGAFALFAGAANATPTLSALFDAIRETGTTIAVDDLQICKDPQVLGDYRFVHNQIDQLTLCVTNHKGNNEELYDTILHESVHVVQACNEGKPVFTPVSIVKVATPEDIVFLNERYPQNQFALELEARVIARDQDEVYVTNLIKEHCK